MSKRNLVIIIALLAIVDIAAAFWYLSLRIEASGESRELWQHADTAVSVADTVVSESVPDKFSISEHHAYYVSSSPAVRDNADTYYVCVKQVTLRWPVSINGNDSLPLLDRALRESLFGGSTASLQTAVQNWLTQPKFSIAALTDYKQIDRQPKLVGQYAHCEQLLAFPILTSLRLLVMQVEQRTRDGQDNTMARRYLHYDRVKQSVLSRNDIFELGKDAVLLSLINDKIERLNQEKQLQLERAAKTANEFRATRTGIVFEYPAGELAPISEGIVEIHVDYPTIGVTLTQNFKNLLNLNDGYWRYKPLDPTL